MSKVDIKDLFEAGSHFGHKTSRWHPKMAPYIHSKRGGSHIIDLTKTVDNLDQALAFLTDTASKGKQVLFVGTKSQAKPVIKKAAEDANMPYVNVRWLGGMLTNSKTINERVKHLKKLEERMESGELANRYSKLEVQRYQEEIDSLNNTLGGIKNMHGAPGAVFVADVNEDNLAIKEAKKLGIPTVAIVDTNVDPTEVDYPIPANDDAIKSITLISGYVSEAVKAGTAKVKKAAPAKKEEEKK
jgi:small subunit ribosomal protein S2